MKTSVRNPFLSGILALLAAILLILEKATSPTAALKGNESHVMTWNMEWFPAGFKDPQRPEIEQERILDAARYIRRTGVPDIFLAQEIRDAETCTNLTEAIGDPAFRPVVCSEFMYTPTNAALQQVAIFSRYPVLDCGYERWTTQNFVTPPRGFVWAVLDAGEKNIACFGVHLKSNYIPKELDAARQSKLNTLMRELAAEQLSRYIEKLVESGVDGKPVDAVIIAGDFNTTPDDPRYAEERTCRIFTADGFRDAFEGIPPEKRFSLPANETYGYPAVDFDRMYYKNLPTPDVRYVGRLSSISDHQPLHVYF